MKVKKILPIIGIILFIYILSTVDFSLIKRIFFDLPIIFIFISFFSLIPIILMSNVQWQIMLKRQKIHVSFWYSLKNILIGYFYGFISPGGYGAYARVYYLHEKSNTPIGKCLSNVILFNTIDYLSLIIIGLFSGLILIFLFPIIYLLILVMLILLVVVIILIYIFIVRKENIILIFNKLLKYQFLSSFTSKLGSSVDTFYDDIPSKKYFVIPFFISIIGWIVRFYIYYLIASLFDINISFLYFMMAVSIANIIGSIPITFYGFGTREMTLISILGLFNIASEQIISLSLYWFVIIWLFPSVIGSLIVIFEHKSFNIKNENMLI
jgi:uncharacterized protein (TIRG00374 family)